MKIFASIILAFVAQFACLPCAPITSAKQYLDYLKKTRADFPRFSPPDCVIFIYSSSLLKKILAEYAYRQGTSCFEELYLIDNGKVGLYYVEGKGASSLIHKMEELVAFGVKKFISVGYAGALTKELAVGDFVTQIKALSEDGVGHLYLDKWSRFAHTTFEYQEAWQRFMRDKHPDHVPFKIAVSWSFPVLFRETKEDVDRVVRSGCNTVEMELGAFFALAQEKKVEALALYVISDSLVGGEWKPHLQDTRIKDRLKEVADLAIEFSQIKK